MKWQQRIKIGLKKRLLKDALRFRTVVETGSGRFVIYNKRKYYNFSCNDYLGLSRHPVIIRAWQCGAECYGVGSSSSGHINGYTTAHYQFEEELANWMGYPRALLFTSGFAANQAILTTLASKDDFIVADRLSHASLLEGASFSQAKLRRFHHNDTQNLLSLLEKPCVGQVLAVTEGIFSMDGDSAPLNDFHIATKKTNSWLMVDDAHGFGVVGPEGRGSCADQKITPELLVITFGKAAGVAGAALLCSEDVANFLTQYAKHLIYSTSMPPAQAVALLASLNIIRSEEGEERRQKLIENIRQFRNGAASLRMSLSNSNCAIQPLIIGSNARTLALASFLKEKEIWSIPIRPPTVPQDTARLRLTLSAIHETSDIISLLEALHDASE